MYKALFFFKFYLDLLFDLIFEVNSGRNLLCY